MINENTPLVIELLTRILSDPLPSEPLDGLYIFCQTSDNELSVLESATALYHMNIVPKIFIMDTTPLNGYPGKSAWESYLIQHGVEKNDIHGITPTIKDNLHTLIEAQSVSDYCKSEGLERLLIMASPFHQLRAFMTMVTAINSANYTMSIYSQTGRPLPWEQDVVHSQESLQAPRAELIHAELARIEKYQTQGDLTGFTEVKNHLDNR